MTAPNAHGPPLTDEELMQLLDGELDAGRREQVAAQVADDEEAQAKLSGLELVGELLREHAEADSRCDGIADAVLAELDQAETAEGGEAEVVPLPPRTERVEVPGPARVRAANDNTRSIFAIAAVAAAVAAGLFFWSRGGQDDIDLARRHRAVPPVAIAAGTGDQSAFPPTVWPSANSSAEADEGEESGIGVEVASVDFGGPSGSVFYVSTGADEETTTAVVWVTDDVTGEGP